MLRVTINGSSHACESGQSILAVLRSADVAVPTLCDDPRLKPIGGCRLCLVELNGAQHPHAACTTVVEDGMSIATHTPQLEQLRRTQLRLLARNHPELPRDGQPVNPFHKLVREYGVESELGRDVKTGWTEETHPAIQIEMSKCIDCFRCVRICAEVAGRDVWKVWYRGDRTEVRPADGLTLLGSGCVSCGACVDTCPSGALLDKGRVSADEEVRTVCPYCGTGCEMHVGRKDDRIVSIRPVLEAPVNQGHLCVKGRYGSGFVHSADRVRSPMIRRGDKWESVSWERAVAEVADRLTRIRTEHGPDSIGILGSSRGTNEENYLTQKFARVVLGTNNVDCCARVCHAPTATGMKTMLGTGAATNSFDDIERAHTFLICGANPTENHPIVGDRIKQAVRRGAKLIVIDPRRIELADLATYHLQLRPGTNVALLNSIAQVLVEEELYDTAVVSRHIRNWSAFRTHIADFTPERVAEICNVDPEQIRMAARLYAVRKPAMSIHGLGLTEHTQGTEGVMCLVNLAILTGNLGKPGSGVNPLRGQNNVQGSAHMGCEPASLTGGAPLNEHRERFENAWNKSLPTSSGRNLMQMIDGAAEGSLKALWTIGYDIALTNPQSAVTLEALRQLDLVIVQDLFLTETAQIAGSIFLPACSSFEKDGTFMNSERRIQRVRKVIEPVGESLSDWEIICRVAYAMGFADQFRFESAEEIWDEIRRVWPAGAGIAYRRLDAAGLQWPCPTEDHPGTRILHTDLFAQDRTMELRHVEFQPTVEVVSEEYPFLLVTGRSLYQFNAGTMTDRSTTAKFRPDDLVCVAPADAERLELREGQSVELTSRYGSIVAPVEITDRVKSGELFATFQSNEQWVNRITGPHRDGMVSTPEYKVTAVRIRNSDQ